MPSSNFVADYSNPSAPFGMKVQEEQGRVRVVTSFSQGFCGRGVERYPSGEQYVGDFVGAKRHGRGTFVDSESIMVSFFNEGKPRGEGVKFASALGETVPIRAFNGKTDDVVTMPEAKSIAKNVGVPMPASAITPPKASKARAPLPRPSPPPPTSYETTYSGTVGAGHSVAPTPARDDFLARLEQVEKKESANPKMSLVPRVA